jgi:hypothetical protein
MNNESSKRRGRADPAAIALGKRWLLRAVFLVAALGGDHLLSIWQSK